MADSTNVDSGSYVQQGLSFLDGIGQKWVDYQKTKASTDLEYHHYDATAQAAQAQSIQAQLAAAGNRLPSWAIGAGLLLAGLIVYKLVK